MKQKVIGIPGAIMTEDDGTKVFGANINNLEFISEFGVARIIMPWEEFVEVDALYLPGGLDMATMDYKETPGYSVSTIDQHKEFFFKEKLHMYVGKVPIFGVCLGMQQLGVYFQSKMTQDTKFHKQSHGRWQEAHTIFNMAKMKKELKPEDILEELNAEDPEKSEYTQEVNSHHHQYFNIEDMGEALEVIHVAQNEDYRKTEKAGPFVVESFKHKTLPIAGVQWHPEELYDEEAKKLFKSILE